MQPPRSSHGTRDMTTVEMVWLHVNAWKGCWPSLCVGCAISCGESSTGNSTYLIRDTYSSQYCHGYLMGTWVTLRLSAFTVQYCNRLLSSYCNSQERTLTVIPEYSSAGLYFKLYCTQETGGWRGSRHPLTTLWPSGRSQPSRSV